MKSKQAARFFVSIWICMGSIPQVDARAGFFLSVHPEASTYQASDVNEKKKVLHRFFNIASSTLQKKKENALQRRHRRFKLPESMSYQATGEETLASNRFQMPYDERVKEKAVFSSSGHSSMGLFPSFFKNMKDPPKKSLTELHRLDTKRDGRFAVRGDTFMRWQRALSGQLKKEGGDESPVPSRWTSELKPGNQGVLVGVGRKF